MCIIADFVENIFFGTVAVATKPSDFKQEDIWSIRHINTLPKELLLHIFRFLGHGDLKIVVLVCKLWRNIGEDPVLWKHLKFVIGRNNISMIDNILETNRLQCLEHLEINGYGDKARPLLRSETVSVLLKCSASKLTLKNCDLTQLSKEDLTSVISKLKTLSLWQVVMERAQIITLFAVMLKARSLSEIDIGYGYLDLSHISPSLFAKSLSRRKKVNLGHMRLSESQLTCLFENISKKTTLRTLDVGYRDLSFIDEDVLRGALKKLDNTNICPLKLITTPYILSHKLIKD